MTFMNIVKILIEWVVQKTFDLSTLKSDRHRLKLSLPHKIVHDMIYAYRVISEEYRTPLISDEEEDIEENDKERDNDENDDCQPSVESLANIHDSPNLSINHIDCETEESEPDSTLIYWLS